MHKVAKIEGSGDLFDVFNSWDSLPSPFRTTIRNVVALSIDTGQGQFVDIGGGIVVGEACDHVVTAAHNAFRKGDPNKRLIIRNNNMGILLTLPKHWRDAQPIDNPAYRGTDEPVLSDGVTTRHIGKDWAILKLRQPANANCNPTRILFEVGPFLPPGGSDGGLIVAGHIDPVRGNSVDRVNVLGFAECRFYGTQGIGNRIAEETGAIAHDCIATKVTSGYPIFLIHKGVPYFVAVHSTDFLDETTAGDNSTGLRVDPYGPGLRLNLDFQLDNQWGGLNAAASVQGSLFLETIQSLYPTQPDFVVPAEQVFKHN